MSKLDDLIQAAKAEVTAPQTEQIEVLIGEQLAVFEFTKLEPMKWRNLIASFMPRADSQRDLVLGYNYDALPSGFPASHIKLVDGETREPVTEDQWRDVFAVLDSPDIFNVSTTIWGLHEYTPQQKAVQAKKASARRKSSTSRKR